MTPTIQTIRGCGTREENKTYLCCGQSPYGIEIEHFIIDPAVPWYSEGHTRGYTLIEIQNVNHVVIFVGKNFYPSPWDFVEEARRFGLSRKVTSNFPFNKLTPGKSRMYFVHARSIPTFEYSLLQQLEYCKYAATPKYGYHFNDAQNIPCTFALQNLAIFHNPSKYIQSGVYQIKKQTYSYNIVPPYTAFLKDKRYLINQSVPLDYPLYAQNKLYKAPVTYTKKYGIFMWSPITHIEAKNRLPTKVKNKIHSAGYYTEILDY
jgi:hypothetical protein